jgi:hypothetical protein
VAARRAQSRHPDAAADRSWNPEGEVGCPEARLFVDTDEAVAIILVVAPPDGAAILVMVVTAEPA